MSDPTVIITDRDMRLAELEATIEALDEKYLSMVRYAADVKERLSEELRQLKNARVAEGVREMALHERVAELEPVVEAAEKVWAWVENGEGEVPAILGLYLVALRDALKGVRE